MIKQALNKIDLTLHRQRFRITLTSLVVAFITVLCWEFITVPIYAGYQGVYWSRFFGGTKNWIITEGTAFKLPWDQIIVYDVRSNVFEDTTGFLTKDGLVIYVGWVSRFAVMPNRLPELHRTIGPDYARVVVIPEITNAIRLIISRFTAEEIYSTIEWTIRKDFQKEIKETEQELPINYEDVFIVKLELPADVTKGIENKKVAEQTLQTYVYKLASQEEERKRQVIEATGIKEFEKISGVSILKWRGLAVTSELASSPNSKIIIMGTGEKSLP
jgi:regulator of protease activity HflC (stomatin/prohibitin superfamily)